MKRILSAISILSACALIFLTVSTAKANVAAVVTVDRADDTNTTAAQVCSSAANDCDLRGAIAKAAPSDTINFDASFFATPQTIILTGTVLTIGKNLTISGTDANLLTVSGNNVSRVFNITGGTVILEKMTITNGKSPTSGSTSTRHGGGFMNVSNLTLNNVIVSNNAGDSAGGGIADISVGDSINSTVTNNISNDTTGGGGGVLIYYSFNKLNLLNTIIAGNFNSLAPDIAVGSSAGTYVSQGNNIIGNNKGTPSTSFTNGPNDQIGSNTMPINALLEPLGNYGGVILAITGETIQTHALLSNSLAVDAGNDCVKTSTCTGLNPQENLTADERGANRVGTVDIGAFEYNTTDFTAALPAGKTGQPYSQTIVPDTTYNGAAYNYCYDGTLPPGLTGIAQCKQANANSSEKNGNPAKAVDSNARGSSKIDAPSAPTALVISGTPTTGGTYTFSITATGNGGSGTTNYSLIITGNAPTAAQISIGGRATTSTGRGIRNIFVRLTDGNGNVRFAYTTTFGYYRFANLEAGETYVITAKGKRFEFAQPSQVLNATEDASDVNFVAR